MQATALFQYFRLLLLVVLQLQAMSCAAKRTFKQRETSSEIVSTSRLKTASDAGSAAEYGYEYEKTIHITIQELATFHSGCQAPFDQDVDLACRAASHRLCMKHGLNGGMLVEFDSENSATVTCVLGVPVAVPASRLADFHNECQGKNGPSYTLACDTAASAFCWAAEGTSLLPPHFSSRGGILQEYDGLSGKAEILCMSTSHVVMRTPTIFELSRYHPDCGGSWNPDLSPITCNAAFSRYCRATGDLGGFITHYDSVDASAGLCVPELIFEPTVGP